MVVTPVSPAMVLAIVDEATEKDYASGVIGLRGAPDRAVTADLQHKGQTVRVRPAESALAVREVLAEHRDGDWLVVVTDRDDGDLGAGVLAHFVWQRLRSPDPWEAVRHRFAATGIDPALTSGRHSYDLAAALLAATPPVGWPAAPAGVLTRAHALSSVAKAHLGLESANVDVLGVLRWTMSPDSVVAVADLRQELGDRLADETLDWIADLGGAAAEPIGALLRTGEMGDIVPVGVVLQLLTSAGVDAPQAQHLAQLALARLEQTWGGAVPTAGALRALGAASTTLLADLVHDLRMRADVDRVVARADAITERVQAGALSIESDLLPRGFRARLVVLAEALRRAVQRTGPVESSAEIEKAWARVASHRLGRTDARMLRPFEGAVRLTRWLASSDADRPDADRPDADHAGAAQAHPADLARLTRRHVDHGAWADTAINDAFGGVDDPELSPALSAVITAAQRRRHRQERAFAAALVAVTTRSTATDENGVTADGGMLWYLERLLPRAVIPMAKKAPILLLVMDGMSVAAATEILADATDRLGWIEAALPDTSGVHRSAGLSVLPSVTEVSRASLLTGRLQKGQQAVELKGYEELTRQGGKIRAQLFHKKGVDTTGAGRSVSDDVGAALDDPDIGLVTVVLNTIDDALDRSDPAGTTWTADAVKHLEPLLARARAAGRTVVMTSDHGHVVERRQGTQRSFTDITSGRSRAVTGSVEEGEIEVAGVRVLTPDHRAVLAVDEGLRYGPLKAGYHGGASAAEVVVPVAVLLPDEDSNPLGLTLLPPQVPVWWLTQEAPSVPAPASRPGRIRRGVATTPKEKDRGQTLFDDLDVLPKPVAAPAHQASLGRAVLASGVYRAQRKMAGRLIVTDEQIAALVDALHTANGTRLPRTLAARALAVNETRLQGALAQAQQLVNVEGYAVLAADPATGAVLLDAPLLREQFEVP